MNLKRKRTVGKREKQAGFGSAQFKAALLGLAAVVLVLALETMLISASAIPEGWMDGCVVAAAVVGVLISVAAGKALGGKGGLLRGAACGAVLISVCLVSGLLLYGRVDVRWCALLSLTSVGAGALAGTLAGSRKKGRR